MVYLDWRRRRGSTDMGLAVAREGIAVEVSFLMYQGLDAIVCGIFRLGLLYFGLHEGSHRAL